MSQTIPIPISARLCHRWYGEAAGEYVGLEEVSDGLWDVYFGPVTLGRMDERTGRITDHKGRTVRRASPADSAPATVPE